jgi:hypothetical protein
LEGYRPKQVLTLLGKVTFRRAYYRCVMAAERREMREAEAEADMLKACTHGEALWTSCGDCTGHGRVRACSKRSAMCASSTLEEAAETLSRLLPLQMSARQALNLMQPLGEAFQQQEDEQVRGLWEEASQARTAIAVAPADK